MKVDFQWEPEEWREAVALASATPSGRSKPVMTYAVIGMMSLGAVGEMLNTLRSGVRVDYGGSLMPLLLFAGAVVAAVQVYTRAVRRTRQRPPASMPTEAQRLLLSEDGWQLASAHQTHAPMRPWNDLWEQRTGDRSLILLGRGGAFAALPLRALKASQQGHLHRLLMRKLHRPA